MDVEGDEPLLHAPPGEGALGIVIDRLRLAPIFLMHGSMAVCMSSVSLLLIGVAQQYLVKISTISRAPSYFVSFSLSRSVKNIRSIWYSSLGFFAT